MKIMAVIIVSSPPSSLRLVRLLVHITSSIEQMRIERSKMLSKRFLLTSRVMYAMRTTYPANMTKTVLSNLHINCKTRVICNLSLFRRPLLYSKEALGFQIIAQMEIVIFL